MAKKKKNENYAEIGRAFALREKVPKFNSSVFVEGDTIYSYGYYYPMVKRYEKNHKIFLINSDNYSVTTSAQRSGVANGIMSVSWAILVWCSGADWRNVNRDAKEQIETLVRKAGAPRANVQLIDKAQNMLSLYAEDCRLLEIEPEVLEGMSGEQFVEAKMFDPNPNYKSRYVLHNLKR